MHGREPRNGANGFDAFFTTAAVLIESSSTTARKRTANAGCAKAAPPHGLHAQFSHRRLRNATST
jgi:hypothetical protein